MGINHDITPSNIVHVSLTDTPLQNNEVNTNEVMMESNPSDKIGQLQAVHFDNQDNINDINNPIEEDKDTLYDKEEEEKNYSESVVSNEGISIDSETIIDVETSQIDSNDQHIVETDNAVENVSSKSQDSFFTCSKREVCEEVLENKCSSEEGPRPETICSDISLEDCSVTPLGSAFETCDTVYNKYCRPRLTDLDKRIYDETLKEKQRSISFGQSEGEYEFETLFDDEFQSLFNEEPENAENKVDDANKVCQVVEVESCNTHHHLEIDTGRRWSCLDVPTVSCETFLNSDSRMVKNCKQSKAEKCQQFNVVGHIIQPRTKCNTEKITHCSEKGKPRKSGLDLVDCELEKKYICGPHHTTQLVLNECSWNMYPVCHKLHTQTKSNDDGVSTREKSNGTIRKKREICRDVITKKCRMVTDCS